MNSQKTNSGELRLTVNQFRRFVQTMNMHDIVFYTLLLQRKYEILSDYTFPEYKYPKLKRSYCKKIKK